MFQKAKRIRRPARIALIGPTGSGKTYTALAIAKGLARGGKVAALDSEAHSIELYGDIFDFDAYQPETFGPEVYIEAIGQAVKAGYAAMVIDSLSHAWMGKGGTLDQVDRRTAASKNNSSFDAWRQVSPQHARLVDALVRAPIHLVVTMRVKTEYVIEEDARGKKVPRKVGLQPVQRDGLEYEFDLVADMDGATLTVSKCRYPFISEAGVFNRPGESFGASIVEWLEGGEAPEAPAKSDPKATMKALAAKCAEELGELCNRPIPELYAQLQAVALRLAGGPANIHLRHITQARDEIRLGLEADLVSEEEPAE